jgi:hypothetical protein
MAKDRHKPNRRLRLPESLAARLERLAERRGTSVTEEMIRAVRELLDREREGEPPPQESE